MTQISHKIYNDIVANHIGPLMKVHGFKKKGSEFHRLNQDGDIVQVLGAHFRKIRGEDAGWITVGVRVGSRSVARFLRMVPQVRGLGNLSEDAPIIFGTDLGHLGPSRNLQEWQITPKIDTETLGQELLKEIRNHALPFFERYLTLKDVTNALESGRTYNSSEATAAFQRAAIYWIRGDQARATTLLEARIQSLEQAVKESQRSGDINSLRDVKAMLDFLRTQDSPRAVL